MITMRSRGDLFHTLLTLIYTLSLDSTVSSLLTTLIDGLLLNTVYPLGADYDYDYSSTCTSNRTAVQYTY